MDIALLIEWVVESIIIILLIIGGFAYLTLFERRTLARVQIRIGPNRAGPAGILQPIADAIKLIFKEELIPYKADKFVFLLAPIITVIPALVLLAVVPFGPDISLFGRSITLGLAADVNVGVLSMALLWQDGLPTTSMR
jgi:NADH-quinone oxidoreductase subunit H